MKKPSPRPKAKKRVTILDVAKDAEVSFAAVSKVLRNAYGVSEALRQKVNASIGKLGYTPNTAARGMRGGHTYVIGVIFPDMRNAFFADILAGMSAALEQSPYQMIQGIAQHSTEMALAGSMIDMQVDGLIIVGSITETEVLSALGERVPTVLIGHHMPGTANCDTVNNDDAQSGQIAVRHLVDRGFRDIAMLSLGTVNGSVIRLREGGYRAAMEEAELTPSVERTGASLPEIRIGARSLLERRPEAVFCWTDYVAMEVISVAAEMGLAIPGDIAVVGHDNTLHCELSQNALTSIDQSGAHLGQEAARLILERIEGRSEIARVLVHPRLVERQSSRRQRVAG